MSAVCRADIVRKIAIPKLVIFPPLITYSQNALDEGYMSSVVVPQRRNI